MRIDKFLRNAGIGTRTEIKKYIRLGLITAKGKTNIRPETHIDPLCDEVFFQGKRVIYKEFVYIMMNKPQGYISATYDKRLPTVIDLLPEEYLHFEPFPAGRLDIDTVGLLLLTNDGELAHNILSPKKHIPKTYLTRVNGALSQEDTDAFLKGVDIGEEKPTKPAVLSILSSGDISEAEITITEGKFHQIKRMFGSRGKEVIYLKRIKMNGLCLDEELALGECRELSEEELRLLKEGF